MGRRTKHDQITERIQQLSTIEYVLTWGYSDDEERDTQRLKDLRIIRERCMKIEKIKDKL
jgi:predicted CoA-binding protein